jgi:hypothetical protein
VWRLQARPDGAASQEARSPAAPDEGAAFSGCDLSDEGQRECCLDNVSGMSPSVRRRSPVASSKIATGGAPEGAPAGHTAGGTLKRCQTKTLRLTGAPLPLWREKEREGGAPRLTLSGADESRPYR